MALAIRAQRGLWLSTELSARMDLVISSASASTRIAARIGSAGGPGRDGGRAGAIAQGLDGAGESGSRWQG